MATHIEAKIVEALCNHLSGLTLPSGVLIEWPNITFTPVEATYLSVRVLKNEPLQPRIKFGQEPIRQGIFQVSVVSPAGKGILIASELAGSISTHFKRGTKLTQGGMTVLILEEPRVSSDIQEPAWSAIPVSIYWTVYT